jgi:hypothetical protein
VFGHGSVARGPGRCDHGYPRWGGHTTESILPRARRTGFSHGGRGFPRYLASALRFEFRSWGRFRTKLLAPVPCRRFSFVRHGNEPPTQYIRIR